MRRLPSAKRCGRRGAIAASRGRDRFAPACVHRQAVQPISTGRRRGRVFSLVSGALPESGATRDAREARKEQHFRARSRPSISGGSVSVREGRRLHLYRVRWTFSVGGTDLLATSPAQDSTLLQFKEKLPGGVNLAGWNTKEVRNGTYAFQHQFQSSACQVLIEGGAMTNRSRNFSSLGHNVACAVSSAG